MRLLKLFILLLILVTLFIVIQGCMPKDQTSFPEPANTSIKPFTPSTSLPTITSKEHLSNSSTSVAVYSYEFIRDYFDPAIRAEIFRKEWNIDMPSFGYGANQYILGFADKADSEMVAFVQDFIAKKAPGLKLIVIENSPYQPTIPDHLFWRHEIISELKKQGLSDEVWVIFYTDKIELRFQGKEDKQIVELVQSLLDREAPEISVEINTSSGTPVITPPWFYEVYSELQYQGTIEKIAWITFDNYREEVVLAFTGKADQQIVNRIKMMIELKSPGAKIFIIENEIQY